MNKQQEEEFLAEEKETRLKRSGCLLIMGVLALEAVIIATGTTYYLTHQDEKSVSEPVKITKKTDLKNKVFLERSR
ncbi:MAG: hypothetical protein IKV03_02200 [Alphaproteobacteria bacterium]|nr:hypothetical protein [Alphaproteobacteria bacterium]